MEINKLKKSELLELYHQIEKQLSWYKSFFDNATDAVFVVQPETWCVLDANDYAAQLLDTNKEDILGIILPQFRRIFKLLNKSSSPIVLSEMSLDVSSAKSIMLEVSARFMKHENQELILAIARDVSEQHALTDKLVQADKLVLLGQLSAGVTHEIRNPLAAINLNLQILKRNTKTETPEYEYINTALQGVERIARIVEVTLNFSKPALPDIQDSNINTIVTSSMELVASVLKRKEIKIELKLADKMPKIPLDAKQIQQVLINLITNAADAVSQYGLIQLKTYIEHGSRKGDGEYAVISVTDNGAGIPPEDLPKIFNPFFTRKPDGTGLGLPITQRIMHQHSGVIDVESTMGKGSTIYVKLPIPRGK
ncbi:MAG: PAS domain-containing protein [Desulfobulbaceae bacterium]|nr:PAS domain-containing protein [Candidatus Kapabacteria bacterium]MBS4001532.1 PAS domain-containing protein [Desulfobulbaceae bacterium]